MHDTSTTTTSFAYKAIQLQDGASGSGNNSLHHYRLTLILLCVGYFIDFYDLTIFSAGYVNIISELFAIHDTNAIQQLYLKITNYYTTGIFVGSILFGVLSDKYGRTAVIRYSILLYSLTIIASVFTHSIYLFTFLRFLSGVGLATEFATSSVLISEVFPQKYAARFTGVLYFCGILGGMVATYLSGISWKIMFLFGGGAGIILYVARKKILESGLFLSLDHSIHCGSVFGLFNGVDNIVKFIRLLILILPFFFLIAIMFIYPRFMPLQDNLSELIRVLLLGFFIGNLISTLGGNLSLNYIKDFRVYIGINTLAFGLILSIFPLVTRQWFLWYALLLGLLGGGLPSIWVQVVIRSYGINQRSTAANSLNACGRLSMIAYNMLASYWICNPQTFSRNCIIFVIILSMLVFVALFYTPNNYNNKMNYTEPLA